MTTTPHSTVLERALECAQRGWPVLPVRLDGSGAKRPLIQSWPTEASTDERRIKAWWQEWPEAIPGVVTGERSGLYVLDVDRPEALAEQGFDISGGREVQTRRVGGSHIYYSGPLDGRPVRNTAGGGLDFRGQGGFVCVWNDPPSGTLSPLPEAVAEWARGGRRETAAEMPDVIEQGARESTLVSLAGTMRRRGAGEAGILAALRSENESRCRPPLDDADLRRIAGSVARYGPDPNVIAGAAFRAARGGISGAAFQAARAVESGQATQVGEKAYYNTDQGRAELFIDHCGESLRYLYDAQHWMVWDGKRWHEDIDSGLATQKWTELLSTLPHDKLTTPGASSRGIKAMLHVASTSLSVRTKKRAFDDKVDLVAFRNGTLDLDTDEWYPANRAEDLLVRRMAVEYKPNAPCPMWLEAVDAWTRDEDGQLDADLRGLLERAVGYTLSGRTGEKKMFLLLGGHDAGKSVFIDTLVRVFGSYGITTQQTLVTGTTIGAGRPDPELADLPGVRLAKISETDQLAKLNSSRVKGISGAEEMRTRTVFAKPFSFDPQVKIWIASNDRPRVSATDDALWGRILEIPFRSRFPKDPKFQDRLLVEREGIATWAVECYRRYKASPDGLGTAAASEAAAAEHKAEEDTVLEWLEAAKYFDYSLKGMRRQFNVWAKDNGEDYLSAERFKSAMMLLGWEQQRTSGGRQRLWVAPAGWWATHASPLVTTLATS